MLPSVLFVQLTVTLTTVYCFPPNPMRRSAVAETDADELTDRLSKLKTLLERLEAAKVSKSNLTKDLKEYKNTREHSRENVDEKNAESGGTVKLGENVDQEKIINMKKFVDSLTPEDIQKLQILRGLVQEARRADGSMLNDGSFAEKEVPESDENTVIDWKQLAQELEEERNGLQEKEEKQPVHIETETKEGTFGAFKDEIKYAVEKNLLTDVALAVHSGISVEEILADITGKGSDSNVGTKHERD